MNNLTTRKIVLGMLMTLVLAFSVQGVADALTLTETSPVVQSKRLGTTFEISFTVGLTGATTAYDDQSPRRRVTDHNTFPATWPPTDYAAPTDDGTATRIDSSGYQVRYIGSTAYRFTAAQAESAMRPTGGTSRFLSLTSSGVSADDNASTAPYYVDSSGSVVDSSAKAVYIRTGASGSYSYSRAKADPQNAVDPKYRSDYNEEMISVVSDVTTITIKDKSDGQLIFSSTVNPGSMDENSRFGTLERTVALICEPSAIGTYVITVADTTPTRDVPRLDVGRTPAPITFTLHVTAATAPDTGTDNILPDIQRRPVDDDVVPVTGYLAFESTPGTDNTDLNRRIRYEVVKGGGTLYVGTFEEEHTTPRTALSVHQASMVYLNTNGGSNEVHVWFADEDRSAPRATIIYEYKGQPVPTTRTEPTTTTTTTTTQQARLLVSVSGEGTTRSVTVSAINAGGTAVTGIGVVLSSPDFTLSQAAFTGTPVSITLPSTAGDYSIFARHPTNAYAPGTATVTVAGPALGTLTISPSGVPVNGVQDISIIARTADNTVPTGALSVTLSGTGFTTTVATVLTGSVIHRVVLPAATGTYTLNATAPGYDPASIRLTVGTPTPTTPTPTPTPTTPGTVGTPSSIRIASEPFPSGTANRQLASPLSARVLDANGNGVASVRVTFQVVSGQGRLSQRGNGRAVRVNTDRNGNASANYTPLADGTSRVRATAAGVAQTVTFTITAGAGAPSTGTTTPRTEINPSVQVNASQRPPMLWVDGGKIYALVGASVQEFASSVDNAINIAVGGGKVYWTEKTGESAGTINSANLNGSGVKELASILAVPMGIAVSSDKLYWTNSRGRIQSADLDGSGITNVISSGLEGVMDLALAGGNAYWTQGGNVRFVNLTGQKQIRNISTGTDTTNSLAIGGGKVYWTEMTGSNAGTINSANLNGSGATELASILAAPSGIAVDGSRSKLYWTNSRGRVQSANLNGSKIQNVVSGLGNPGDMVLSNSITAPTATTTTTTTTTTTARSKYDVNGDGKVDNTDAGLVSDALGTNNAKYDVDGNGTVNFLDLLLVFDNRDAGAAAAPTILGMKLSAAQIDIIEEQIDLLIATGDRSPAAMRTLIYLQQLIVMARPEKTQLLANYPNPFNPETWIPYELATDTTVKITIYNTQGVVIRTLELGHQSAGYYTGRDRAAYWDGRNALGEQVASGIYFYQFETDEMSSMRKMVILK